MIDNCDTDMLKRLKLNLHNGPWLAGNLARKFYLGEDTGYSDWDIWFKYDHQRRSIGEMLSNIQGFFLMYDTKNADTYKYNSVGGMFYGASDGLPMGDKEHTIQLIKKNFAPTPEDIIKNFDFTVCQVITDGKTFILNDQTRKDIETKTLRLNRESPYPISTQSLVQRVIKYMVYGFTPDKELQHIIENNENINWDNLSDDYDAI